MPHLNSHDLDPAIPQPPVDAAAMSIADALAIRQTNLARPGEKVSPEGELWTVSGMAEHIGAHPDAVRAAIAATGVAYRYTLDGIGVLGTQELLTIARWLSRQGL
jgi:hypothetical protein